MNDKFSYVVLGAGMALLLSNSNNMDFMKKMKVNKRTRRWIRKMM